MTVQAPEKLVNEHPRVDLSGLSLYGVIRGDCRSNHGYGDGNAFMTRPSPPADATVCTALWRGYIATFVLQADGRLRLECFEYPLDIENWRRQEVNELLVGDFWMLMTHVFFGPRTYVPFRDGAIVEDKEQWFTEEPDK